jgi:hypothetical protein
MADAERYPWLLAASGKPSPAPPTTAKTEPRQHHLSTIIRNPEKPRDAKTDNPQNLKPKFSKTPSEQEERIRTRGVVLCYDALAFDNNQRKCWRG